MCVGWTNKHETNANRSKNTHRPFSLPHPLSLCHERHIMTKTTTYQMLANSISSYCCMMDAVFSIHLLQYCSIDCSTSTMFLFSSSLPETYCATPRYLLVMTLLLLLLLSCSILSLPRCCSLELLLLRLLGVVA